MLWSTHVLYNNYGSYLTIPLAKYPGFGIIRLSEQCVHIWLQVILCLFNFVLFIIDQESSI